MAIKAALPSNKGLNIVLPPLLVFLPVGAEGARGMGNERPASATRSFIRRIDAPARLC
jgi:hypothetical protein